MYKFMALRRAIASIFPFLFSILGVVRAQTVISEKELQPVLDWTSLILGKNLSSLDGFILVVLLTIFMVIVLYQAVKKSGVFQSDNLGSNSIETVIAVILTLLVMRFMPIEYYVILLVGFLILAVLLTFYTLFKMITGTVATGFFTKSVLVLITGFGVFATGTLMVRFDTTLKSAGFVMPDQIAGFGNIFIGLGVLIIAIGVLGFLGNFFKASRGLIGEFRQGIGSSKKMRVLEGRERGARTTAQKAKVARQEVNIAKSQFYREVLEAKQLHNMATGLAKAGNQKAASLAKNAEGLVRALEMLSRNEIILLRNRQQRLARGQPTSDIDKKINMFVSKITMYQLRIANLGRALNKTKGTPARTRPRKAKARTRTRTRRKITGRTAKRRRR